MATNLHLDDDLIDRAVELGGHPSKRAAVTEALQEYVNRLEQQRILPLFGAVEYDREFDYKTQRRRS
jgi:Arc/MetJ family transcription regulator